MNIFNLHFTSYEYRAKNSGTTNAVIFAATTTKVWRDF
jgi:hypothetical protein